MASGSSAGRPEGGFGPRAGLSLPARQAGLGLFGLISLSWLCLESGCHASPPGPPPAAPTAPSLSDAGPASATADAPPRAATTPPPAATAPPPGAPPPEAGVEPAEGPPPPPEGTTPPGPPPPPKAKCGAELVKLLTDSIRARVGKIKGPRGLKAVVSLSFDDEVNLVAARLLRASGLAAFDAAVLRALTELRSNPLAQNLASQACAARQTVSVVIRP